MKTTILKKLGITMTAIALLSLTSIGPAFAMDSMNMSMEGNMDTQAVANTHGQVQWFIDNIQPLNNSGVHGFARLKLQGNQLTVWMTAQGLEPNQEHMQHIHGMISGSNSSCPTLSANTDADSTISLEEGVPFYGPVLQSLTPFQTPGINGFEVYQNTFTVNMSDPTMDVLPLANREIVLHGMTVTANQDLQHPTAGYDASLPVACGHIMPLFQNGGGNGIGNGQGNEHGSSVSISGNGAESQNSVNMQSLHATNVSQTNDTSVTNDVHSNMNTGNNQSSFNQGGNTFLSSGSIMSMISHFTHVGMNMFSH